MALDYLTWWLITPGVACFLLLNVLVAAIAFTSQSRAQQDDEDASTTRRRWLCRSASSSMVLDRLRSFAKHPSVEFCYYISPKAEELKQVSGCGAAHDDQRQLAVPQPAAMATTSTVSENAEDETAAVVVKSMSSDGDGTCALDREGRHAQEPMPSSPPPAAAAPAVAVVTVATARVAALVREPPKEEPAMVAEIVKRKHRRRDHVYAVEGKAELNARADQFIRQFRQELRLQRLDSMLRRHTNTLSNSSGGPTSR